eukprot:3621606-Ditylum_brightwellii.AAC.1
MMGDKSVLGALLASLLTYGKQAGFSNFASACDHLRCRLMNSNLICLTNSKHIQLMFDVGCNIKSHGQGSIMVQKRGFKILYGDGGPVIQGNDSVFKCKRYVCDVIDSRNSVN